MGLVFGALGCIIAGLAFFGMDPEYCGVGLKCEPFSSRFSTAMGRGLWLMLG